jgi:hypothetical protein
MPVRPKAPNDPVVPVVPEVPEVPRVPPTPVGAVPVNPEDGLPVDGKSGPLRFPVVTGGAMVGSTIGGFNAVLNPEIANFAGPVIPSFAIEICFCEAKEIGA